MVARRDDTYSTFLLSLLFLYVVFHTFTVQAVAYLLSLLLILEVPGSDSGTGKDAC